MYSKKYLKLNFQGAFDVRKKIMAITIIVVGNSDGFCLREERSFFLQNRINRFILFSPQERINRFFLFFRLRCGSFVKFEFEGRPIFTQRSMLKLKQWNRTRKDSRLLTNQLILLLSLCILLLLMIDGVLRLRWKTNRTDSVERLM